MGGIIVLTGLALLVIFMIWFPIFMAKKIGKTPKQKMKIGFILFAILFAIFIGPEIYQYSKYRFICAFDTVNETYDQEAYKKYLKNSKNKKVEELSYEQVTDMTKKTD